MNVSREFAMIFLTQAALIAGLTKPYSFTLLGVVLLFMGIGLTYLAYVVGKMDGGRK